MLNNQATRFNIKCLTIRLFLKKGAKRKYKRNLKQLDFLIKDRLVCFLIKLLTSTTANLKPFFFYFPNNWVGRAMGNETFYRDDLKNFIVN